MPSSSAWQWAWRRLPSPVQEAARAARRRVDPQRRWQHETKAGYDAAADAVRASTGFVVATGPFAGMRFVDRRDIVWPGILTADAPFLLGSYEAELHRQVEDLIARGYADVVDVGSAEGYYAVGLARRLPDARVVAFDADPHARELCARLSEMNGVADRVQILGEATHDSLRQALRPGALLVCDCEGCELPLLDPAAVPELAEVDLLVELHDFLRPGVTPALVERFSGTHDIVRIAAVRRDPAPYRQWLGDVPEALHEWIVSEFRGGGLDPHHAEWGVFLRRTAGR